MADSCKACGGRGEWQEKHSRKFITYDKKGNRKEAEGEVLVDVRCASCKGSGLG